MLDSDSSFDSEVDERYGDRWLLTPATCRRHRLLRSLVHDVGMVLAADELAQMLARKGIETDAGEVSADLLFLRQVAEAEKADDQAMREQEGRRQW